MNTKTNNLHSEMVKRNFELGKEIERLNGLLGASEDHKIKMRDDIHLAYSDCNEKLNIAHAEIERLKSELDDANESISSAFLVGAYETRSVTKKLNDLLIQAKPYMDDFIETSVNDGYVKRQSKEWILKYNELMGEEND